MFHFKKGKGEAALPNPDLIREFMEAFGEAVVVLTSERDILYMNSGAKLTWGEREGQKCYRALRESREVCADCPLDKVVAGAGLTSREMRMPSLDGWHDRENLYVQVAADTGNHIDYVAVVSTNIDQRKALERQVQRERGLNEQLLGSVSELAIGVGEGARVLFANFAIQQVTGYTEREIMVGGLSLLIPEDSREQAADYLTPDMTHKPVDPVLIPLLTRAGEQRMVSWTFSPIITGEAGGEEAIALGQDVTDRFTHRKEAERRAEEFEYIANQRADLLESLRESEERYRALVDNSLFGVLVHDGVDVVYSNERMMEITGFNASHLKKVSEVLALVPLEERETVTERLHLRLEGQDILARYDTHLVRRDGSIAVVNIMNTPITLGGRRATMVTVNDISDRVQAEAAVKASEERYRTLVENSQNAVLVVDSNGGIIFANQASAAIAGATGEAIVGQNIYSYIHPDEQKRVARIFRSAWQDGIDIDKQPIRSVSPQGDMYFEVTTSVLGKPGPDAHVMVIANDVTEREAALHRLKESEDRYRTIVEKSRDGIIVSNRGGEVLYANPMVEALFGREAGKAQGKHLFQFIHPDDRERVALDFVSDWKTGQTVPNYPIKGIAEDGRLVYVEATSGIVGWPADDAVQIFVVRDVTERRKREEERELQLKVEEEAAAATARFSEARDVSEAMLETLRSTGELLLVDRTFYMEFDKDGLHGKTFMLWSAGGGITVRDIKAGGPGPSMFAQLEELAARGVMNCADVASLDDERLRDHVSRRGAGAFATALVFNGEARVGIIGFIELQARSEWSEQEINLLKQIAGTASRAMERKAWIEELELSERFRTRITESIGEGLLVLRNGVVIWVNNQAGDIYGYESVELMGKTSEFLMPEPARLPQLALAMLEALTSEGAYVSEEKAKRKDGALIDVMVTVTALGSAEESTGDLLVAVKDITLEKRMREEVAAAAEAYSTIFSSAADGLLVHTLDGEIVDANERAGTYSGHDRLDLLGMHVTDLVSTAAAALYEGRQREVMEKGMTTFEVSLKRLDGDTLPVEITSRRATIWGEDVVLSAIRDITQRRKAEKEVERRARQLAALNEIVKASASSLDLDTVVEATLGVAVDVTGASNGLLLLELPPGRGELKVMGVRGPGKVYEQEAYRPDRLKAVVNILKEASRSFVLDIEELGPDPMQLGIESELKEAGIRHGLLIPLKSGDKMIGAMALGAIGDGVFSTTDTNFYDAIGAEIGVSIENALIYRELAAEHERLSLLYRSAQSISGDFQLESMMHATAAEAARAVGADSALVVTIAENGTEFELGATFNIDPELFENVSLPVQDSLGGYVVNTKRALVIAEGDTVPETVKSAPVAETVAATSGVAVPLIAGDRVLGVLGIIGARGGQRVNDEDVRMLEAMGRQAGVAIQNARLFNETRQHLEALEKANAELMTLDRMKSDFVSTVSHELRSPLAVIEGFAKTLVEHFDEIDRETEKESIEIILKKSIALEGLIENILDMSRIEEGRLDVNITAVSIGDLCERVLRDQERVADMHEVIFEDECDGAKVLADPEKTEVALANLVRNAVKFSPEGGEVHVHSRPVGKAIEVTVTDQGIGIPPHELERIFDRFYQVDSSETRSFQGSGLGLYIARELIQAMHGTVNVVSESGAGSTFIVTLPRAG